MGSVTRETLAFKTLGRKAPAMLELRGEGEIHLPRKVPTGSCGGPNGIVVATASTWFESLEVDALWY